jgi:hypothetical protein
MASRVVRLVALLALAGCAAPARAPEMTVPDRPPESLAASLSNLPSFTVTEVDGGGITNPLWTSEIEAPRFRKALTDSLRARGLLADGQSDRVYDLRVEILDVDQPLFGADLTVATTARYVVVDPADGSLVFDETVTADYTAEFGDAFFGFERLQLANEGSAQANIRKFIESLAERWRRDQRAGVSSRTRVG